MARPDRDLRPNAQDRKADKHHEQAREDRKARRRMVAPDNGKEFKPSAEALDMHARAHRLPPYDKFTDEQWAELLNPKAAE